MAYPDKATRSDSLGAPKCGSYNAACPLVVPLRTVHADSVIAENLIYPDSRLVNFGIRERHTFDTPTRPSEKARVDRMPSDQTPHIAVISDRKALAWVLTNKRIAFPEPRLKLLFPAFKKGDVLYLYTTRGCFKNPKRDRGRIISKVVATSNMTTNDDPIMIRDRPLPHELAIKIES